MICSLSDNQDLKNSLEEYVNGLIKEKIKEPFFDPKAIANTIKQDIIDDGGTLEEALAMSYHVPQIIFDLIDTNPEFKLREFVSKGYNLNNLLTEIEKLEKADDKLQAVATFLGVQVKSIDQLETIIADQPTDPSLLVARSVAGSDVVVYDKNLSSGSLMKTTQVTNEEGVTDSGETIKIINQMDPDKKWYQEVLEKVLSARKNNDPDFSTVTYKGQKGLRAVVMHERDIPGKKRANRKEQLLFPIQALVITNNEGDILYFNEVGEIADIDSGKPVYFILPSNTSSNLIKLKAKILARYNKATPEELIAINNDVNEQIKAENAKRTAITRALKNGPVLVNLLGGMKGALQEIDTLSDTEQKKASSAKLSSIPLTEEEKASITFTPSELKGVTLNLPAIKFDNYDGLVTLKNSEKLGEQDEALLNNIVNILMDDVSVLGTLLTADQKVNYVGQFLNLNMPASENQKGYTIGVTTQGTVKQLFISIDGKTQPTKEELKTFLGENTTVHFKANKYADIDYTHYELTPTDKGFTAKLSKLNYFDFIAAKFTPRVAIDVVTGRPVVVNGYFTFDTIVTEPEIKKEVAVTTKEIENNNIPTTNKEEDDIFLDLKRSKLIESKSSPEQDAKAELWWNKETALRTAVDQTGKPLFSLNLLRNVVNSDAWADFRDATITLYAGANYTHVYHEAWHAFSQIYLTKAERTKLYTDASKLKGSFETVRKVAGPGANTYEVVKIDFAEASRLELEEFIAEEFRVYAMNNGKFKTEKTSILGKIFDRIWKALKALVGNSSVVDVYSNPGSAGVLSEMFNALYTAKTKEDLLAYTPSLSNAEFGTLNSGIIDAQGESVLTLSESLLLTRTIDGIMSDIITDYVKKGSYGMVTKVFSNTKYVSELYKRALAKLNARRDVLLIDSKKLTDKINELVAKQPNVVEHQEAALAEEILRLTTQRLILDNKLSILSKATSPEVYGDIPSMLDGESTGSTLIAFHRENSAFKDRFTPLKLEKDDDATDWDETSENAEGELQGNFDKPSNGIASEDLANDLVLYLVKSLTKQQKNGEPELNELGFAEPIDFKAFWRVLMDKASGETSVLGLYNKLNAAGKTVSPLFTQLLNKIYTPKVSVDPVTGKTIKFSAKESLIAMITEGSATGDLWMKLVQSLNLHRIDLVSIMMQEKGAYTNAKGEDIEAGLEIKVGKSTASYQKIVNRDWPSKFQQEPASLFIKKNKNQINELRVDEVVKAFIIEGVNSNNEPTYTVAKENYIPFLHSIGIYLTDNAEIRDTLVPDDINYIADAIGKVNQNNKEASINLEKFKISNIVTDLLTRDIILHNDVKIPNNGKALNELGQLEADYSEEYTSSMKYTASNELKSTGALNSTDTQKMKALNNATKRSDLYSKDSMFMHMNYLNPENTPQAKGLITMNSLFATSGVGAKVVDNKIELYDLTGTQYIDIAEVSKGKAYSKMNSTDKIISSFIATLAAGFMEGITPGDKSSYFCMKTDRIITYDNKKTSYLYIDTEAFLRTIDGKHLMGYDPMQEVLKMLYPKLEGEIKRIAMIKADPEYYSKISGFKRADKFDIFDEILDLENTKNNSELKDQLSSKTTFEELNSAGSLIDLLSQNPILKKKIDTQILSYFDKLIERYNKNLFDPAFGENSVLPTSIANIILKGKHLTEKDLLNMGENQDDINENVKQAAIRSFAINNFIHKTETTVILQGDGFQFDHTKEAGTKRTPGSQSGGRVFGVDELSQIFVNSKVGRVFEKLLLGKSLEEGGIVRKEGLPSDIRHYNGIFNSAIIKESEVSSSYFDMFDKLFRKDLTSKGYTDPVAINKYLYGEDNGKVGNATKVNGKYPYVYGGKMASYAKIKDGDGQGWITFDSYRILKRLEGQWSDAQELAFNKLANGESLSAYDLSEMFPVYKLQYNGPLVTEDGRYPVQSFHKFSLFPLIPSVIQGYPAEKMHKAMMSQNIDYALFTSGSKRSHINGSKDTNGDEIYNGDTSNIKAISEIQFTPNPIYVTYLKNQTDVNNYFKDKATFSSQLRKLLTATLYANGVPVDYFKAKKFKTPEAALEAWEKLSEKEKLANSKFHTKSEKFINTLNKYVAYKKKELLKALGVTEADLDKKTLDADKLKNIIVFLNKELKRQGFSEHERSILNASSNLNSIDLSISPLAARFEKLIMAVVNNRLAKPKLKGEPLVEVSSALMQNFTKPTDVETAEHDDFATNGLSSYIVDLNGLMATIGFRFKRALNKMDQNLFKTNYFVKNKDGVYVNSGEQIAVYEKDLDDKGKKKIDIDKSLARLNEMVKLDAWLNDDNNKKKIRITGVRIPTQGDNSMEFGQVYEFLKPEAGPIIIIPAEIVAKSGTDFDVDKMTVYLPYITENGTLLEDISEEDLDLKIQLLNEKFIKLKDTNTKIGFFKKEKSTKLVNIESSFKDFREAIRSVSETTTVSDKVFDNLVQPDDQKLLNYISTKENMMKAFFPDAYAVYTKKIKGITFDDITAVKKALKELYEEKSDLSTVYKELSDANEHKRNYIAGIQNELMDNIISILELPEKAVSLLTPNDTNIAKPLADALKEYIQEADNETDFTKSLMSGQKLYDKGISSTNIYTEDYNLKKQQENIAGKGSLGIAAVDNYINNLLNMAGGVMNKYMRIDVTTRTVKDKKEEKKVDVPITLFVKHNLLNGKISLSHILDAENKNSIAEIISQLMNGFVDVANDAWVAYLQANLDVVPKILFMLEAGVPLDHIAYLVSNPITRSYIKDKNRRSSLLSPMIYGEGHDSGLYQSMKAAKNEILDQLSLPKNFNDNRENIYGYYSALETFKEGNHFTKEALKAVAISKKNFKDEAQVAGFLQYLYIESLIEDYNDTKKALNPDTKTSSDLFSAEAKTHEVEKVSNTLTMDPKFTKYVKERSIVAAFFIQEFARKLFSRFFKIRDNDKVNKFLIDITSNRMRAAGLKKATGYDSETYVIKFKNFIAQYIFSNQLKQYTRGSKVYKTMPIPQAMLDQANIDFERLNFDSHSESENSYRNRGLAPVNTAAFTSLSGTNTEAAREDFIEFVLEREYLRSTVSLASIINSKEFKLRKERLVNTGSIVYSKLQNESEESYNERLDKLTYENYLANKALTNTYNIWQLFRSGDNTVARELMDIIQNYPEISDLSEYSMLKQFVPEGITRDEKRKYRNVVNFKLKNSANLDEGLISEYNGQWNALMKHPNPYIADFFTKLPLYAFLQTGMESSEFSLASVMPYKGYKEIMEKGAEAFLPKLDKDSDNILEGLKALFEIEHSTKNKVFRNRGLNYKRSLIDLPVVKDSLYEQPYLKETFEGSDVFVLDRTYYENGIMKNVTKTDLNGDQGKGGLIRNNPNTVFLLSPADLVQLGTGIIPLLSKEELEQAKVDINVAINAILYSGDSVVIDPAGFVKGAEPLGDTKIVREESHAWVSEAQKDEKVQQFLNNLKNNTVPENLLSALNRMTGEDAKNKDAMLSLIQSFIAHPKISKVLSDVKLGVFTDSSNRMPEKIRIASGVYMPKEKTIYMFAANQGKNKTRNLLHETIHALTVDIIDKDAAFAKKIDNFMQLAKVEIAKKHGSINPYGLLNTKEFLAEAFTNPAFQQLLAEIKTKENVSLFNKFVTLLTQMFAKLGLKVNDSLLNDVLNVTQEAILGYNYNNQQSIADKVRPASTQLSASVKPIVEIEANYYTPELLRANLDKIYVFGDNNERQGKKGQASIRDEANAMGISTKLRPSADENAFMTDAQGSANAAVIDSDIAKIKATGKTVVFPKDGLGTGLAALKSKAPWTYAYLVSRLKEEFGFNNDTGTLVVSLREAFGKPTQPATNTEAATYTNHSGGAYGGDTFWDIIGREFGVTKHMHYKDAGNANLSQKLRNAGVKATILTKEQMDNARSEVERLLGEKYPDTLQGNLQVRNYFQVANADAIFAVAELSPTTKPEVMGGTNTAVKLGIKMGKPVYVFDLDTKKWYTQDKEFLKTGYDSTKHEWNYGGWIETSVPTLTKNFAGVGTRDIESYNVQKEGKWVPRAEYKGKEAEEAAKKAIRAVYEKTFKIKRTTNVKGVEISSNAQGLAAALTNPTELAKSKGNITKSYPVEFRGKTYKDSETAYQALKNTATKDEGPNSTYNLMVDIIKAKLEQHPILTSEISKQGGSNWILASTHQPTKQNTVWETGGKNWFIKALNEAYLSIAQTPSYSGLQSDELSLYLSKQIQKSFGVNIPSGPIDVFDLISKMNMISKEDIDNKKLEC